MQFFAVRLNLFPVSGFGGPGSSFIDRMYHLILPAIALGLVSSALILRFTQGSHGGSFDQSFSVRHRSLPDDLRVKRGA